MTDNVNKPNHYMIKPGYEVIDLIRDRLSPAEFKGYCKGNMIKYLLRFDKKNGLEDLNKMVKYKEFFEDFVEKEKMTP